MRATVTLVLLCLLLSITVLRAQPAGGAPVAAATETDLAKL